MSTPPSAVLLRARDLKARLAISQTTLWRYCKQDPSFPRPILLPGGHRRWRLSEIEAWEASLPREAP